MAKQANVLKELENAAGPAEVAKMDDIRRMRQFIKPADTKSAKIDPPVFDAGHNLVVDRRDPDTIKIEVGLDQECRDNILARGERRFLALTRGAMFDSREMNIDGERYFLTVKLEKYIPKAKASKA